MGKRFRYSEGYRIDGFVVGNENELGSEDDDKESEESDSGVHTRYKDATGRDQLGNKWIAREAATPKGVKASVKVKQEPAATSISKHGIDINNIRVADSEVYKKDDRNDLKTFSPKHNTEFEEEHLYDSEATTIIEDTSEFELGSESSNSEDERPALRESHDIKPAAAKQTIITQAKTEALPAKSSSSMFKQSGGLKRSSQIIVQPSDDARFNKMVESFNPSTPKRADQGHAAKKRRTV